MTPSLRSSLRASAWRRAVSVLALGCAALTASAAGPELKILFLGDNGPHTPGARLRDLAPDLIAHGIHPVYTEDTVSALTLETLKRYDAVLIYGDLGTLAPAQEQAIVDYVNQGGGLVPVHSAASSFANSNRYIALVGASAKGQETGVVRTKVAAPDHPVMKGIEAFESTDEILVPERQNETGRTVLETRDNQPWTWVRTEGKGRVFYTAWGHDHRTWAQPGFHALLERGIRYAAGQQLPEALAKPNNVARLEHEDLKDAKVPYYSNEPGAAPRGANPWKVMQRPLSAEQSMGHIVVPGGFELQLFAADPEIKKPISMAWDERGRLWIIETTDYPNRLVPPGEPGNDRIVICEDTNKDGRADKFTVFADHLNVPTSLTFSNGGVIVHQMPNTLFLKDTDGDDKADVQEVLISGWGRRDTHAGPSNLQYGPDNWIWGVVGYSGFDGTVGGKYYRFSQGWYRFKPDGSAIEFPRNTNNNTWGLGFNEMGIVFGSTANNNPSTYMPIPARYYEPAGLTAGVLGPISDTSRYLPVTTMVREVDVFWGYTAGAGHAIYAARSYPKEYWNRVAFTAEPTGHLVGQFILEADGANFHSHNPTNLVASDDEWVAPIFADVGPDGSVWVIDWYNYIIQHNPTPDGFANGAGNAYENPLRDKRHGRIYRVVWKDGKPSQQPNLHNASPSALVAALKNDNLFWRRHAQRLLVERGRKDVVPDLLALLKDQSVDEIGFNPGATHALWTLAGLNAVDSSPMVQKAVIEALKHPSAAVRRNAIVVLPRSVANTTAIDNAGLLSDSDGQVRLAAMLALADSPETPGAGQALHNALAESKAGYDRWSMDGAKMAAVAQAKGFNVMVTDEEQARAKALLSRGTQSLLNGATLGAGLPSSWTKTQNAGEVTLGRGDVGHGGAHSLQVALKGDGASGGANTRIKVKPNFRYEVTGWIKTDGLPAGPNGAGGRGGGGGRGFANLSGATLLVQQLGGRGGGGGGAPTFVRGTSDWTQVKSQFAANSDEVTLLASVSLGASGTGGGSAWFDEVAVREIGPVDESVTDPLSGVINHLNARAAANQPAAPAEVAPAAAVTLNLGVVPDVMKYDKTELTVKAGLTVKLVFKNNDHMQHNFLLLRPGAIDKVGALADQMMTDTTAAAKNYVPLSPDILTNTPLVNPGETAELNFTAPTQPGRYPFICTFPGHWRLMQGTLVVTP